MPAPASAEPHHRFAAFAIDVLPPTIVVFALFMADFSNAAAIAMVLACAWFVTRDVVFGGQSPGKQMLNLHVVDALTRRAPTRSQNVLRNALFGVPLVNVLVAVVEGYRALKTDSGERYGDEWAGTHVIYLTPEILAHIERHRNKPLIPASLRRLTPEPATETDRASSEPSPLPENSEATASLDFHAET